MKYSCEFTSGFSCYANVARHMHAWATPLSVSYSQRELLSEILTRVCHDSCSLYSSHEINDFNNELNYHNNCRNFCGTQRNAFKLPSWALIAHLSKYTSCTTVYNCKILILSIKSAHMSRYSACNMICNGTMMTIINKSAHCSRYTACNLHCTIIVLQLLKVLIWADILHAIHYVMVKLHL